jgi:phosphocarrier protein HPr
MSKLVRQEVCIQNRKGLHARASAQIVKIAEAFESVTYISYRGVRAPAQSIMELLMLGAGQGALVVIEGEGVDADKAVSSLASLIEDKFGEG